MTSGRPGRPLRVAINAQLSPDGRVGGIEQAVRGLVQALGRLDDDTSEYVIVTNPVAPGWLDASAGANQDVVVHSEAGTRATSLAIRLTKRALTPARPVWRRGRSLACPRAH